MAGFFDLINIYIYVNIQKLQELRGTFVDLGWERG